MTPEAEIDLLRRVAAKDREAFERLYRHYHPRLFRFLFRFTRRVELVEEILNDVMFIVWQKAGGYEGRSRPSTWIFGIAYRRALKRLDRHQRIASRTAPEEAAEPIERRQPEDLLSRKQLKEALHNALEAISAEQRAVVELTYFHGYSYREIAQIVECPVNTVKTRMFHARRRLRELLPPLLSGRKAVQREGA